MKKISFCIALVLMAALCLSLLASCGPTKTTDAPAEETPSASQPSKESSPVTLPSPPQLDVGSDGSIPVVDWND